MKPSKGYLVVASKKPNFYSLAINCIESIKDYYPDAKCCLVTEEKFLDGREYVADDLIFVMTIIVPNYGAWQTLPTTLRCISMQMQK